MGTLNPHATLDDRNAKLLDDNCTEKKECGGRVTPCDIFFGFTVPSEGEKEERQKEGCKHGRCSD